LANGLITKDKTFLLFRSLTIIIFSILLVTGVNKTKYDEKAELIARLIDIAVDCFMVSPPNDWDERQVKHFVKVYSDWKNETINPRPEFHNVKSLSYMLSNVLTYFQEGSGQAVETFWKEVNSQELDIKREDRFVKILKRGKIKNDIEYDIIIDLFNVYVESNSLSGDDVDKLNKMIANFENSVGKNAE